MKLENQVISRQQAEQLKALGIEQVSVACYIGDELHLFEKAFYNWAEQKNMSAVAAYTVAEMFKMLDPISYSTATSKGFEFGFQFFLKKGFTEHLIKPMNEALGDLLIHLLKNDLITAEEINQRLLAA
jgi:hypothetical protein